MRDFWYLKAAYEKTNDEEEECYVSYLPRDFLFSSSIITGLNSSQK